MYASNATPYWATGQGNGYTDIIVSYNSYLAATGGQSGLYDRVSPSWLPASLQGVYSVFLGSGWGWPGGGAGSGDAFISQTGRVPPGSRSVWFSTSNGGLEPNWDAPYELTVSLDGQDIPYVEIARDVASLTFAGDVSAFDGGTVELQFYLHRLDAAPDEAILLGLDNIYFSSEAIPEPSTFALLSIGMLLMVMGEKKPAK